MPRLFQHHNRLQPCSNRRSLRFMRNSFVPADRRQGKTHRGLLVPTKGVKKDDSWFRMGFDRKRRNQNLHLFDDGEFSQTRAIPRTPHQNLPSPSSCNIIRFSILRQKSCTIIIRHAFVANTTILQIQIFRHTRTMS